MSRHLSPRRKLYTATDVNQEYVEHLGHMFQNRRGMSSGRLDATKGEDFRPYAGQMDTVVCLNVLEHIEDDAATLKYIRTLLEPGGRLILLVPNDPKAYGTVDKEIGHYRRYTAPGLRTLMKDSGYEVEDILKFNRVSMPAWKFTGQVRKARTLSRAALSVFDKFVWLWRKIDGAMPWEPTSIIAIAKRVD